MGIEISSQAYILWIIEKLQVKKSSDVQFDEFTKLRLAENVIVPVAPQTKLICFDKVGGPTKGYRSFSLRSSIQ